MEENNIRKYAELMREMGLTALEIDEDGCKVRLEMAVSQPAATIVQAAAPAAAPAPNAVKAPAEPGVTDVVSPMVGVFYASPAENSAPFVKVGDVVKKGDVLCIIEAMKLMNEITADFGGVVVEVCAGNGQVVDFGHLLFRIRSDA